MPSSAVARTMILLVAMTGCAGPEALFPAEVDGFPDLYRIYRRLGVRTSSDGEGGAAAAVQAA